MRCFCGHSPGTIPASIAPIIKIHDRRAVTSTANPPLGPAPTCQQTFPPIFVSYLVRFAQSAIINLFVRQTSLRSKPSQATQLPRRKSKHWGPRERGDQASCQSNFRKS